MIIKYIFFQYHDYYPSGGMEDCQFTFVDYEDFLLKFEKFGYLGYDNCQILCLDDLNHQTMEFGYIDDEDKKEKLLNWARTYVETKPEYDID